MNKEGITIIICTYEGRQRLPKTLSHINKLAIPVNTALEIVLADNNSLDGTAELALAELSKLDSTKGITFKIINETKPGKLYALQKAIKTADNDYIVICDDDNWLAEDYLLKVYNNFKNRPEIGAFGGIGKATTSGLPLPVWFNKYTSAYAVGSQAKLTGVLKRGQVLWGAGLATKKSLYLHMYKQFPSLLINSDKNILSAEDTEYCLRLILKGYRLYYDDEMKYEHYIPDFKLDKDFLEKKLLMGFTNSRQILSKYYPAVKVQIEASNRPDRWIYLFICACFKYIFLIGRRKTKAKDTLFHLLPFWKKSDPLSTQIKTFVKDKTIPSLAD